MRDDSFMHGLFRGDVVNWGDVPTALTFLGALIAALYARSAWKTQVEALRLETQRLAEDRESARRELAELVTVDVELTSVDTGRSQLNLEIENGGQLPIRRVVARLIPYLLLESIPDNPGWEIEDAYRQWASWSRIDPLKGVEVEWPLFWDASLRAGTTFSAEVHFVDGKGRRWMIERRWGGRAFYQQTLRASESAPQPRENDSFERPRVEREPADDMER